MSEGPDMAPCRRRRPTSPSPSTAGPMSDEDLLSEILLCLPPQPSSLPRASLVCKQWRRLLADPAFLRRFRARHGTPPLLGVFSRGVANPAIFRPLLGRPDLIPSARLSLLGIPGTNNYFFDDCRHGLVLLFNPVQRLEVVLDPVTGDQRRVALPPGFHHEEALVFNGAVLCADRGHVHGSCHSGPFKVAVVATEEGTGTRVFAAVYSSETGAWGDTISLAFQLAYEALSHSRPSTLAGNSIYWLLSQDIGPILELDLGRDIMSVIELPPDVSARGGRFSTMRAENGGIGLIFLSGFRAQLWTRGTDGRGVAVWVPQKSIELDKLLSLRPRAGLKLGEFDEDNNAVVVWSGKSVFTVNLYTMSFTKLPNSVGHIRDNNKYRPFTSF